MNQIDLLAKKLNFDSKFFRNVLNKAPYLYIDVKIPKKNGGYRNISIPDTSLKLIQEKILNELLYKNIYLLPCLHGGIPQKSIITNAYPHINKQVVVNIDIKNFFPSIHITKIGKNFEKFFNDQDLIKILTRLTTHNYCLPQGSPTSPFISNLPLIDCDNFIFDFCNKNHLIYTRYFDDITISGKHANKFLNRIIKIINQSGFQISHKKTKIQSRILPQYVTGLIVNKKLSIPPEDIKHIQYRLEILDQKGLGIFDNGEIIKEIDIVNGKIAFLQQVQPDIGRKFREKFNNLKLKFNL